MERSAKVGTWIIATGVIIALLYFGRDILATFAMAVFLFLTTQELREGHAARPDGGSFAAGPALVAMLPDLAHPGEPIIAMSPMNNVVHYELWRGHQPWHFVALPSDPSVGRRIAPAMGPAGAPPSATALVILRHGGHSLDHLMRFNGLPMPQDAPQHVLSLPGHDVLRLKLPTR